MSPLGTFLNGRDPVQLRGVAYLALSESGTWLTNSGTSDAGGGASSTWTTAGSAIPCRVDALTTGSEGIVAERLDDRSSHQIMVPPDTPITHNDRFLAGTVTYSITAVRHESAEWLRVLEAVEL